MSFPGYPEISENSLTSETTQIVAVVNLKTARCYPLMTLVVAEAGGLEK